MVAALSPRNTSKYPSLSCYAFRGEEKTLESANYSLFNPSSEPGSVVVAGSCAARVSIGSHVACRLALEHFSQSLLDFYSPSGEKILTETHPSSQKNLEALETAFRDANRGVYNFGHSLAAGGRMAAVFLAMVLRDGYFVAGRAGGGSAFLYRDGELFSFFENSMPNEVEDEEAYLGARSLVSVDLANVPAAANDQIFIFSEELDASRENELSGLVEEFTPERTTNPAEEISRYLFETPSNLGFCFALYVGPEAVFLPAQFLKE